MLRPSAVLDTNVVVSAHLNPDGYERFVLDLGLAGSIRLFVSDEILEEYREVLHRRKFGWDPALVAESLELIRKSAATVRPTEKIAVAKDPDGNKFLECAGKAGADYVVYGNKRHFPKRWENVRIVNARELLEELIPDLHS